MTFGIIIALIIIAAILFVLIDMLAGKIRKIKQGEVEPLVDVGVMNEIKRNYNRYLGLFANASLKEITAQVAQVKAFARVGKKADNPLLLQRLLGSLPDDEETITEIESLLNLPGEKEQQDMFWFVHGPNPDEDLKAIELLDRGKERQAMEIWEKRNDREAMQNIMVASLIMKKWKPAIEAAQKLYQTERDIRHLVNAIAEGFNLKMKRIVDAVTENLYWPPVMQDLLIESYRKSILEAIDNNDSSLLEAAEDIVLLREKVGADNVQYQDLANQLAVALADQSIYSRNLQYVAKCLNKAYDIAIDEDIKAMISNRLVDVVEHDDWGRSGARIDIPEVKKAWKEQVLMYFFVIVFIFIVAFFVGRCTQSRERKRQAKITMTIPVVSRSLVQNVMLFKHECN